MSSTPQPPCDCLECRIRRTCGFVEGAEAQDLNPAINALGSVLAECLAHYSTDTAKKAARALLEMRKVWMKHPCVAVQQPAAGHA